MKGLTMSHKSLIRQLYTTILIFGFLALIIPALCYPASFKWQFIDSQGYTRMVTIDSERLTFDSLASFCKSIPVHGYGYVIKNNEAVLSLDGDSDTDWGKIKELVENEFSDPQTEN
jgi:hypothetical protein